MLEEILATKKQELASLVLPKKENVPRFSFHEALQFPRRTTGLIAEVKKASPSKGVIKDDFDPVAIAEAYAFGGADALSVLTDQSYFQGNRTYLSEIKRKVQLPVLRKDFIIDPLQVEESDRIGADAILLIVGSVPICRLYDLYQLAEQKGMDSLVEVHSKEDLEQLLDVFTPRIIGVNNRNLATFETSLSQTKKMAPLLPESSLFVSESGISSRQDVEEVVSYGAAAVLIGEALMRSSSPKEGIQILFGGN